MPFFFTSPPAEWRFFCFSDGDFFVLATVIFSFREGDFFVLATVFFVLVVVHLTNKLSHTHTMHVFIHMAMPSTLYMAMVSCADGSRRAFWSCRPWRVSALIHHVLGLRQAAAARLGVAGDEEIEDVAHVGVAFLGGSGAIFWTTAVIHI